MARGSWLWCVVLAGCAQVVDNDPTGTHDPADNPVVEDPGVDDPGVDDPVTTPIPLGGDRTPSSALLTDASGRYTYMTDTDNGVVVRMERGTDARIQVSVGAEPTRMVRVGQDLFVTLRGAGELVRIHDDGTTLTVTQRAFVGAEPFDVVVSHDTDVLYVSLSQEDAVLALDGTTLAVQQRFAVAGEPRSLVTTPQGLDGGPRVYVSSAREPVVRQITPSTGAMLTIDAPDVRRFTDPECDDRLMKVRLSGDMAIDSAGVVYAPALYADTRIEGEVLDVHVDASGDAPVNITSPAFDTGGFHTGGFPPIFDTAGGFHVPECEERPTHNTSPYGGRPVDPVTPGKPDRFSPALLRITPTGEGVQTEAMTLSTLMFSSPNVDFGFGPNGLPSFNQGLPTSRGYPSSVTIVEEPLLTAYVTMPSIGAIVSVKLDAPISEDAGDFVAYERGASFLVEGLSAVAPMSDDALELVAMSAMKRRTFEVSTPDLAVAQSFFQSNAVALRGVADLAPSVLPADVLEGRRLFYTANDPRMSSPGAGVSCETCHTDGRSDGFTWLFDDFPRQTPHLAGKVSDTLPITWTGTVETVAEEVHATTRSRMGGEGVDDETARKVAAYVDWSRDVARPAPRTDAERDQVARGKALFESASVGCVTCHVGEEGTDGQMWQVARFDLATNTPTLRGIGGSAPYFHDGSAKTLRAVLERARDGSMGNTGDLSDAEMDDLEAYLRTL